MSMKSEGMRMGDGWVKSEGMRMEGGEIEGGELQQLEEGELSAVWGGARGFRGRTPSYIRRAIEEGGKTLEDFLDDEGNLISPPVS